MHLINRDDPSSILCIYPICKAHTVRAISHGLEDLDTIWINDVRLLAINSCLHRFTVRILQGWIEVHM